MNVSTRGAAAIPKLFATTIRAFAVLVRAESRQLVREAGTFAGVKVRAIAMLAGGAVFGLIAVVFAALGAAAGLAIVLPAWAAALVVAGALLLVAGILTLIGVRGLKRRFTAPAQTVGRIKEDLRWAANRASR